MRISILLFILISMPAVSLSQTNIIAIFGDSTHSDCDIPHQYPYPMLAYVFHYSSAGATDCSFRAPWPSCLIEIQYGGDIPAFSNTIGNSQTGVTIEYDECLSGWIHVLTIHYWDYNGLGFPPCCEFPVLEHSSSLSGQIEITDCHGAVLVANGISGIGQRDEFCPCAIPSGILEERHSWGLIKALYE
jgi:hypothetical protein